MGNQLLVFLKKAQESVIVCAVQKPLIKWPYKLTQKKWKKKINKYAKTTACQIFSKGGGMDVQYNKLKTFYRNLTFNNLSIMPPPPVYLGS